MWKPRVAAARLMIVATATTLLAVPLRAQVGWTDWTGTGSGTATGTLTFGSTTVGVTYSGGFWFVQTVGGTNYWAPDVYTSASVPNPPPASDIIALNFGGPKSIVFSQAVTDPLFAFLSWNGQGGTPVSFTGLNGATPVTPTLQLLSQGNSFWGPGTASVNANNLVINGEVGGTVRIIGTFTQIDFSDITENWHGFTVGAIALAPPPPSTVPEPATLALVGTGLLTVGGFARRMRKSPTI